MTINDAQLAKFAVSIVTAILATRSTEARIHSANGSEAACSDCGGPLEVNDYSDAGFIVTQAFATFDLAKELDWWKVNVTDQPVSAEPLQMGGGNVKLVM